MLAILLTAYNEMSNASTIFLYFIFFFNRYIICLLYLSVFLKKLS